MSQRLILCFDGTWQKADANADPDKRRATNVVRFYDAVTEGPVDEGVTQTKWYDEGLGTHWYDGISSGAFGLGLDQKIMEGYWWLAERYPDPDPGDAEIFLLGFSRGAYTARSLVGMIRNVGLLKAKHLDRVQHAYALYRDRTDPVDSHKAVAFRRQFSRDVRITFLGVWDTVGALGIPLHALQWLNSAAYAFHDTALSRIVVNAYHAVAVDEHRVDFEAALWTDPPDAGQNVEQRWFIGSHGDVGGGVRHRMLPDIALAWMMQTAASVGLVLAREHMPEITSANWNADIDDSYGNFLGGLYAMTHAPYYRPMMTGTNERKDDSLSRRSNYAPGNPGF
jgi:uncharacterized protein (DUF2235 family)